MSKKLGLFIDANSVNWALTDQENDRLIDMGTYMFPAGCENFGAGKREQSKRTGRRLLRLRRIRYARIRARKYYLLRILAHNEMCPVNLEELTQWKKRKYSLKSRWNLGLKLIPMNFEQKG